MGEQQGNLFEPQFNRSVKVQATDHRITSRAGVILLRDAEHRLGLFDAISKDIRDPRRPDRIRYRIDELIRERVFAMAVGCSAQDDLDRLAHDPAFRAAVWNRTGDAVADERLASQPTQSRLISILTGQSGNLQAVRKGLAQSVQRHVVASGGRRVKHATVDIDSFPIEVHGKQHGARYNGYYKKSIYHPLVASLSVGGDYDSHRDGNRLGNGFIHATLRQGQVHTANGMKRFVDKTDDQAHTIAQHIDYRLDAGYTIPAVMDELTSKNRRFVGRLKTNAKLDAMAVEHIARPPGRPPEGGYESTVELGPYQIDSWTHAQRLILVVVDQPDPKTGQLNLMPRWFFLVTNWPKGSRSADELLAHYRKRGTFEDRLGEFNESIGVHLSSQGFKQNEATMLLALLAFNLNTICRNELEDAVGGSWDMRRFVDFVLKVGGRMVKHSRRLVLRIAQSAEPLWSHLIGRLETWQVAPPKPSPAFGFVPPPEHSHLKEVLRQ
ncbi:IS1380 family transposase [Roseiconus lacunae]|uniref:IS1380 family transposase n=1 Tax=Roseiconus lacunae TaxID=2605694 RepID=UPI001E4E0115|nr:IS1380 family transposase [Roseiconus lacunae]MCD0462025.1 IS1380 family transposase [Roseiconus lacunae]